MDGILLFNKPILWTSHDAVDFIRRRTGQRRVGHAGTLDPMATGLLILLLGRATQRMSVLGVLDKEYQGVMTLGLRTDTFDLEGRLVGQGDAGVADAARLKSEFARLTGRIQQQPPAYSAVKVHGKKLYEYSRAGITVEVQSRSVEVTAFDLENVHLPDVAFTVVCSKGTYVRTLCEDVGRSMGCGAVLSALSRTRIGVYHLKDALDESQVRRLSSEELCRRLIQ